MEEQGGTAMTRTYQVITPANFASPLSVVGTDIHVLLSASDTHSHEVTLQSGQAGMGPPPHSHDWEETFYVLEGSILFVCDGDEVVCEKGTCVHVPAGSVHAFRYGENGGKMFEVAGKGRATQLFTDLSQEVPPGPPDIDKVLTIFDRHGVKAHF